MMQLATFMWFLGACFAVVGFLRSWDEKRGWNEELFATAGIVLTTFAFFQIDGFLRGTLFLLMSASQIFYVQFFAFVAAVIWIYNYTEHHSPINRSRGNTKQHDYQSGFLGSLVGFANGYLIGGSIWYFLDINEYPLDRFVFAPAANSPSAQAIETIPLVFLGGGVNGTGDVLAVGVLVMIFVVLFTV